MTGAWYKACNLLYTASEINDVAFVVCKGEIDNYSAPALKQLFIALLDSGATHLVLDYQDVCYIDSTALGVIIRLYKQIRERDGELVLCVSDPRIERIFSITGLNRIFTIVTDVHQAEMLFKELADVACPVDQCPGWTRVPLISAVDPRGRLVCSTCGTSFQFHGLRIRIADSGDAEVGVHALCIPTYEEEFIRVAFDLPSEIGVVGRLDLFAAESLERAWNTVPEPRSVVFDLRQATEFSLPGLDKLLALDHHGPRDRSVILADYELRKRIRALGCEAAVSVSEKKAVAQLKLASDETRHLPTTTVRLVAGETPHGRPPAGKRVKRRGPKHDDSTES